MSSRVLGPLLVAVAAAIVLWARHAPLSLDAIRPADRAQFTYPDAGGREHVYLGGFDSYYWLRMARNALRRGTLCDAVEGGSCRDLGQLAPVGGAIQYLRSPHVFAIAALHRLIGVFDPRQPLPASAFLVSALIATLGVLPAFAVGRRLGGSLGGLFAALVIGLNPLFLARSSDADNDAWNVALPLFLAWAAVAALTGRTAVRRIGFALGAVLVAGLHALTWNGWSFAAAVVLASVAADAGLIALRALTRPGRTAWRRTVGRRLPAVLLGGAVAAIAVGLVTGTGMSDLREEAARVVAFVTTSTASGAGSIGDWPNPLETATELAATDPRDIAEYMGGAPYFLAAWLGLLLVFLPRRDWDSRHFATLVAGACACGSLLRFGAPAGLAWRALLVLPLAAAAVLDVFRPETVEPPPRGGVLIAVWFVAAFHLALFANRFVLLLVPPFGLAFGVTVGRLYERLLPLAARLPERWRAAYPAALSLLLCLLLVEPLRQAHANARMLVPRISDVWWSAFERIRDETPADAIVTTWWPYGYWAEYVTERRASADGGSLSTRVPQWLARALLAPTETETVGLLRMLDCGSDGPNGAYRLLLEAGMDSVAAHATVIELARRGKSDAGAYLQRKGLDDATQLHVLAATHCVPPPGYLVLSSEMIRTSGWKHLAAWDFRRAYLLRHVALLPEADLLAQLVDRLEYSGEDARALYRRAAALTEGRTRAEFVAPPLRYLGRGWSPCRLAGAEMVCPLSAAAGEVRLADEFAYAPDSPETGRLRWHDRGRPAPEALVRVAGAPAVATPEAATDESAAIGVLVDASKARVLAGSSRLLGSTFTRLFFLEANDDGPLHKFDDRVGYGGERVVTWEIRWERAKGGLSTG